MVQAFWSSGTSPSSADLTMFPPAVALVGMAVAQRLARRRRPGVDEGGPALSGHARRDEALACGRRAIRRARCTWRHPNRWRRSCSRRRWSCWWLWSCSRRRCRRSCWSWNCSRRRCRRSCWSWNCCAAAAPGAARAAAAAVELLAPPSPPTPPPEVLDVRAPPAPLELTAWIFSPSTLAISSHPAMPKSAHKGQRNGELASVHSDSSVPAHRAWADCYESRVNAYRSSIAVTSRSHECAGAA